MRSARRYGRALRGVWRPSTRRSAPDPAGDDCRGFEGSWVGPRREGSTQHRGGRTMSQQANPVQNVTFASNGGDVYGYLALPASGKGPGLIVIQEWWGLTTHMAQTADRLAAEGYVALAPDLYGGTTTHDEAEALQMLLELPVDRAVRDLRGAVDYLLSRDEMVGETVGVVGFCMGGSFALQL